MTTHFEHILNMYEQGHTCVPKDQLGQQFEVHAQTGLMISDTYVATERAYTDAQTIHLWLNEKRKHYPQQSPSVAYPQLNQKQHEALETFAYHHLLLLTGGPGTGKTYTLRYLIQDWLTRQPKRPQPYRVLMLAPTGKAAARMKESLRESVFAELQLSFQTIHRALNIHPGPFTYYRRPNYDQLEADLIIIDEVSMIDTELGALLLSYINPQTPVVFSGDPEQLPAIGPGLFLMDILSYLTAHQGPVTQLTQNIRQDHVSALYELITMTRQVDKKRPWPYDNLTDDASLKQISCQSVGTCRQHILAWARQHSGDTQNVILSPFKKGPLGSDAINQLIRQERGQPYRRNGDPTILTQNLPSDGLSNGDTGQLIYNQQWRVEFKQLEGEHNTLIYDPTRFDDAWALTIHKTQGSEYQHVCLVIPPTQGEELSMTKRLFYTGITRAKKSLTLIGALNQLHQIVRYERTRYTIPLNDLDVRLERPHK